MSAREQAWEGEGALRIDLLNWEANISTGSRWRKIQGTSGNAYTEGTVDTRDCEYAGATLKLP